MLRHTVGSVGFTPIFDVRTPDFVDKTMMISPEIGWLECQY
jgi:hypothetical protein